MNRQEEAWAGEFGDAYLQRNQVNWGKRIPFWREVNHLINPRSTLEVGCSAGWNLLALRVCGATALHGIEINSTAARDAVDSGFVVANGRAALMLPWLADSYDLVFTCGVLIHVGPEQINSMMQAIVGASRRYVLCIEYEGDEEAIMYRGQSALLWKRRYGAMYALLGLRAVRDWQTLTADDGFDNCTAWLMEKVK